MQNGSWRSPCGGGYGAEAAQLADQFAALAIVRGQFSVALRAVTAGKPAQRFGLLWPMRGGTFEEGVGGVAVALVQSGARPAGRELLPVRRQWVAAARRAAAPH